MIYPQLGKLPNNLAQRIFRLDGFVSRKLHKNDIISEQFRRRFLRARDRKNARATRARFIRYYGEQLCNARSFFNFGAGNWKHEFFQNIDIVDPNYPNNKPDIVYDAFDKENFPVEDNRAQLFYFSHVSEHLPDEHNMHVLREVFRCLVPGGTLRITYPDLDLAYDAYCNNDSEFFVYDWYRGQDSIDMRKEQPIAQLLLDFFATRAQVGSPSDGNTKYTAAEFEAMIQKHGVEDACTQICSKLLIPVQRRRPNAHINWWNFKKFRCMLSELGFTDIHKSYYQGSMIPPLRDTNFFDRAMPHMSGYVECRKPA